MIDVVTNRKAHLWWMIVFVVSCSMATKLLKSIAHSMQLGIWSDNTKIIMRLKILVGNPLSSSLQNSMSTRAQREYLESLLYGYFK